MKLDKELFPKLKLVRHGLNDIKQNNLKLVTVTKSISVILLHLIIPEKTRVTSPKQISLELLNKVVYLNEVNQTEHDNVSSFKIQLKIDLCLAHLVS